jgi:hypothetical protein
MTDKARAASCACGQLRAETIGEPVRISVCHCLNCQRRTGGTFSAQARWPDEQVRITGERKTWSHTGDSGRRADFHFCPECGTTVAYVIEALPGLTAIPLGTFADPNFPAPQFSVYESRMHAWIAILGDELEHFE